MFFHFILLALIAILPVLTLNLGFTYNPDPRDSIVSLHQRDRREIDDEIYPENNNSSNATLGSQIDHKFYEELIFPSNDTQLNKHWVNIAQLLATGQAKGKLKRPEFQNAYRRATPIHLRFKFAFYGNPIEDVIIATGGFCGAGDNLHSWLAATQYIAPLMANFETTNQHSGILYADTGKLFAVEWRNLTLRDQPDGSRVLTEYDRIQIDKETIASNTVIKLRPKPVCTSIKTCQECNEAKLDNFQCNWCSTSEEGGFCSDKEGHLIGNMTNG